MTGLWMIIIFIILLFFHVPIMISIGVASVAYCLFLTNTPIDMIMNVYFTSLDSFPLIAIPFFILAGELMMKGGISDKLISFFRSFMGKIAGAMGAITVVTSMVFAAVSGSGTATVAAIGGITIPEMIKEKYDRAFACALAATAGALGPIIPPSVAMILYGVIAQVSIAKLFIGGIIPGILTTGGLVWLVHHEAKKKGYGLTSEDVDIEVLPLRKALKEAIWAFIVPIIILAGIYSGKFTPTEAAVVASVVALLIGVFIYKKIKSKEIIVILKKTAVTSGTIMLLVSTASALGRLLTLEKVPIQLAEMILSFSDNKVVVLLIINIFLLLVGMFMETYAAVIILTPVLLPTVVSLGVDPLHFGLILVFNLTIGLCTPPVGVNLFIASRIGNCSIEKMIKPLMKTLAVMMFVLILVTYIPQITTLLPNLLIK